MEIFALICLGFSCWVVIQLIVDSMKNGITPMPSPCSVKKMLSQRLSPDFTGEIVDLGCGIGTMVFFFSSYTKAKVVGYESARLPYIIAIIRRKISRKKNIHILFASIDHADLRQADIIYCYLYPGAMEKLKNLMNEKAKPGAWVISYSFAFSGVMPSHIEEVGTIAPAKIYSYRLPLRITR